MKVHHIGYLSYNIEKSLLRFKGLGFVTENECTFDDVRGIFVVVITNGSYKIELLAPPPGDNTYTGLMKLYKNQFYHVCYESEDMAVDIATLRRQHYVMVQAPELSPVFGHPVAFLMNKDMGMVELIAVNE